MQVFLFGASGRTGQQTLRALRGAGHSVRAFHRRPVDGVETTVGSFNDTAALAAALDGVDAVISTLASSTADPVCSTATRGLLAAASGPLRYLVVAGAAIDVPGDAKALPDRMVGGIMRLLVGKMLADRQAEYALLATSPLRWSVLRPPRLTDAPATGRLAWRFDTPETTKLGRADLADALLAALGRDDLIGRAPFVSEAKT